VKRAYPRVDRGEKSQLKQDKPVRPKDAATLILLRGGKSLPLVLLGRRPMKSRFMPGFFVFPGGKFDRDDEFVGARYQLNEETTNLLSTRCSRRRANALAWTAIRETWEETGLLVGLPAETGHEDPAPGEDGAMRAFKGLGLKPNTHALFYVARAITPTSSPIRYDTRFFVANGEGLFGSLQDSEELSDTAWRPIADAFNDDAIADVTKFALRQALKHWTMPGSRQPYSVPTMHRHHRRVVIRNVNA
jgi:8-oxo-dGTP pyrophosphatase MutT (NUDIX family)